MNKSETIAELASALCKARQEMTNLVKDKSGYGYKYADLSQLIDACIPVLCSHAIFLTQPVSFESGRVVIETTLMLGDQFITEKLSLPVLSAKGMNEVQCIGSTITYGRRYAISSMLGIAQEDSDAAELRDAKSASEKRVDSPISEDQANNILALADETKTDLSKINNYFKIPGIEQLPASKYEVVIAKLKAAKEQE